MGFWDKLRGELIDIIEWTDGSHETMVYRFERQGNEIKYGAKLIVRESQVAVFVNEGKIADIYNPGTYTLETKNMPILTTLNSWMYGFNSPFKAEVYFLNMRPFVNCKWGTKNPIMLRDPEFGPIRLRAFGTYEIKVKDPASVVRVVSGTSGVFSVDQISDQLRNLILTRFTDIIGESKIPALDLAANYNELSDFIKNKISPEFEKYGFEVTTFLVENISLPPAVEEALDKRSSMGIIGNLNAYTQFQAANAMEQAAKNPDGGASGGMGMGMGFAMANQMSQSMSQQNSVVQNSPPTIQTTSFYANIDNQQAGPFDNNTLQKMLTEGRITQNTLLWKQGMPQWVIAKDIPEISKLFTVLPPPLPGSDITPPPLPSNRDVAYFVNINNQQSGPHNFDALKKMIFERKLTMETLIWKSGMANWEPASSSGDLGDIFNSVPPALN